MKRAYPQYLAVRRRVAAARRAARALPARLLAAARGAAPRRHGLDPYLVAALAAQESTFDAGIASSAGAIGLMQIMPATGRGFARRLGIKPFSHRAGSPSRT